MDPEEQVQTFFKWCTPDDVVTLLFSGRDADAETLLRLLYLAHKIGYSSVSGIVMLRIEQMGRRMSVFLRTHGYNKENVFPYERWEDDFIERQRNEEDKDWLTKKLKGKRTHL